MRRIESLREIQLMELDILKAFALFCEKNNLRYYLESGTLLGAVRHKGFIPWDDDIDVSMPRPDYEKFLNLTKQGLGENYSVLSIKNDKYYVYPFAKVSDNRTILKWQGISSKCKMGLNIDVFPLDGCPEDKRELTKRYLRIAKLKRCIGKSAGIEGKNIFRTIVKFFLFMPYRWVGANWFAQQIDLEARKEIFEDSEYIAVMVWEYGRQCIMKKEDYLSRTKLVFEDEEFWCPGNFSEYLKLVYGDYMKIPPEENRVSDHKFVLYRKL